MAGPRHSHCPKGPLVDTHSRSRVLLYPPPQPSSPATRLIHVEDMPNMEPNQDRFTRMVWLAKYVVIVKARLPLFQAYLKGERNPAGDHSLTGVTLLTYLEMIKKFGSLAIVDSNAVPVGMVEVFKSSKVRWEQ